MDIGVVLIMKRNLIPHRSDVYGIVDKLRTWVLPFRLHGEFAPEGKLGVH